MDSRATPYRVWKGLTLSCGHDAPVSEIVERGNWYAPVICLRCPPGKRRKRRVVSVNWKYEG